MNTPPPISFWFSGREHAKTLIDAAPAGQPDRDESEMRHLFTRLAVSIKHLEASGSCYMMQI